MDDTLGWVYYKKGLAELAVRPLEDSLRRKPDNADILYKKELRFEGMGGYVLSPSARDPIYEERYPDKTTVIALG